MFSRSVLSLFQVDDDELNQLMQMLNMPVASGQMGRMMSEISSTDDGEITMDDFLKAMKAEDNSPHTKYLLLRDFEFFRPKNCPAGYIPRDQLVDVLLKHSKTEQTDQQKEKDEALLPTTENGEGVKNSGSHDTGNNNMNGNIDATDQIHPLNEQNATTNATLEEEQQKQNDERHGDDLKWSESDIRDLINNVPSNCFHVKNVNLINYEKLIEIMLGDSEGDPFQ